MNVGVQVSERILTQVVEVTTLPLTAVIETKQGYVMERLSEGWFRPGVPTPYVTVFPSWLPARLLRGHERENQGGSASGE